MSGHQENWAHWKNTTLAGLANYIGFLFAPRNEGKTLAQIQRERHPEHGAARPAPAPGAS